MRVLELGYPWVQLQGVATPLLTRNSSPHNLVLALSFGITRFSGWLYELAIFDCLMSADALLFLR